MTNELSILPTHLAHLPGAPFTQPEIDAAVADVQGAAGWHIVPEKDETVLLDVVCGERRLRLPTRKLVSVDEVRNADTDVVIADTTYRVSLGFAQVKHRTGYWPDGFQAVEVDITHGYETTPLDLLAVVAEAAGLARRGQSIRSVQIDDFQQSFGETAAAGGLLGAAETLRRYSLTGQPLYGLGVA